LQNVSVRRYLAPHSDIRLRWAPYSLVLENNVAMVIEEILTTSIVSGGLVVTALWLARTWIVARLAADIQHENDTKLAELNSQLQRANSTLSDLTSVGHTADLPP